MTFTRRATPGRWRPVRRAWFFISLVVAGVLASAPAAPAALFGPARSVTVGGHGMFDIAARDLNVDGRVDLVVPNLGLSGVAVMRGMVDGEFTVARTYAPGIQPTAVAVADLNGDDWPDIVANDEATRQVVVLLATGDGRFGAPVQLDPGAGANDVQIGDLTGDGWPDIGVAGGGPEGLAVLPGDGAGGFGAARTFASVGPAGELAVADLDGNGSLDAVLTQGGAGVAVLLGRAGGGLESAVRYPTGRGTDRVAVGDLTGDGTPDLAVHPTARSVAVLKGGGGGRFGAPVEYETTAGNGRMAIGDVNGDERLDLAVARSYAGAEVSVLAGTDEGRLSGPHDYGTAGGAWSVAIADITQDGAPDLLASHGDRATVSVLPSHNVAELAVPPGQSFERREVLTASELRRVRFTNIGRRALTITGVSLGGQSPAAYELGDNTCTASLGRGESCSVELRFAPSSTGHQSATIDVESSDPDGVEQIGLSGLAYSGVIAPPAAVRFPDQDVGTTSPGALMTVGNTGDQPLIVDAIGLRGGGRGCGVIDFTITNDTCTGQDVAPGAHCTFRLHFVPTRPGFRHATVLISDSAFGAPHRVGAAGLGRGADLHVESSIAWTHPRLRGTTSTTRHRHGILAVRNLGNEPLNIAAIRLGGLNPGQFTLTDDTCPAALDPGGLCHVSVHFAPTRLGPQSATLDIVHDSLASPRRVALSGTGVDEARLRTRAGWVFSDQVVSTIGPLIRIPIRNVGNQPLTMAFALGGGDADQFRIHGTACPPALAPGARCSVAVRLAPTVAGPKSATLDITDNAPGNPHQVALAGTALPAGPRD